MATNSPPTPATAFQVITDRIIGMLEKGTVPWERPWHGDESGSGLAYEPANLVSKREYRGINVFMLWASGYDSRWWLTFNQAKSLGAIVRKGEHATPVVLWKPMEKRTNEKDADGKPVVQKWLLLRYYNVFNVAQLDGLDPKHIPAPPKPLKESKVKRLKRAAAIVEGYQKGPAIVHGGNRAYYSPAADKVGMPTMRQFKAPGWYYKTLYHELVHSTGHEKRLARLPDGWLDQATYAQEELVAEMGAAFLGAKARVIADGHEQSAAYIKGWLRALKDDAKLVVVAAAQAQKAVDHILGVARDEDVPAHAAA